MRRFTCTLIAVLLTSLLPAWSAQAQTTPPFPPRWATWTFHADFVGGTIDASWIIVVGGENASGADEVLFAADPEPIPCTAGSGVTIGNASAQFHGGYIKCDFPSFAERVDYLIAEEYGPGYALGLAASCECEVSMPAYGTVVALPAVDGNNPVFHHPSLLLGVPTDSGVSANYFAVDGQNSTGPYLSATGLTKFTSDYVCGAGDCTFRHFQNGKEVAIDVQQRVNPYYHTGPTTVYLGYNPNTGELFEGEVTDLEVDPGCRMD